MFDYQVILSKKISFGSN
jgi:hypothetical protein